MKRLKTHVHGIIPFYKKIGETSSGVVKHVKRETIFHVRRNDETSQRVEMKCGHGGALDPLAEGVLVLGFGNGCKKLTKYLSGEKEYEATFKFGEMTTSFDSFGEVMETGRWDHIETSMIEETLRENFLGWHEQTPPIYSGKRVQGKRAYDLARAGEKFELKSSPRNLISFEIMNYNAPYLSLKITCGGGYYVRSLANDLGQRLNSRGHLTALKRTKQGIFHEKDCFPTDFTTPELYMDRLKIIY